MNSGNETKITGLLRCLHYYNRGWRN